MAGAWPDTACRPAVRIRPLLGPVHRPADGAARPDGVHDGHGGPVAGGPGPAARRSRGGAGRRPGGAPGPSGTAGVAGAVAPGRGRTSRGSRGGHGRRPQRPRRRRARPLGPSRTPGRRGSRPGHRRPYPGRPARGTAARTARPGTRRPARRRTAARGPLPGRGAHRTGGRRRTRGGRRSGGHRHGGDDVGGRQRGRADRRSRPARRHPGPAQAGVGEHPRRRPRPGRGPQATASQAVRDAEGPALVVTSDPRVWSETKDARAKLGPVLLYDPTHRCDTPARLHWSPTTGCQDKETAAARAAALLAPVRPTARADQADGRRRGNAPAQLPARRRRRGPKASATSTAGSRAPRSRTPYGPCVPTPRRRRARPANWRRPSPLTPNAATSPRS